MPWHGYVERKFLEDILQIQPSCPLCPTSPVPPVASGYYQQLSWVQTTLLLPDQLLWVSRCEYHLLFTTSPSQSTCRKGCESNFSPHCLAPYLCWPDLCWPLNLMRRTYNGFKRSQAYAIVPLNTSAMTISSHKQLPYLTNAVS